jgi:hypothetical protein
MTAYLLDAAVVAVGLAMAGGSMLAAPRSAQTHEQSVRRQRTIVSCVLVTLAAILLFDAVDTQSHRPVNLVLLALMVLGVSFDVAKARLSRQPPRVDPTQ